MADALALSENTRTAAGIVLLTIVAIEWGGLVVLRMVRRRRPATPFQLAFARAGHAHAGVLVTLALICLVLADATDLNGLAAAVARNGVPAAAILMPAGFFLSSAGRDATEPNRLIILLYAGAVSLAAGVVALGVGLLTA